MSNRIVTPAGFTKVTGMTMQNTILRKLIKPIDKVRDIATRLGARPYTVSIIKTKSTVGIRSKGIEEVVLVRLIEPTPIVKDLLSLAEIVHPVGLDEVGSVKVDEISGRYTEDQLRGYDDHGNPPGEDEAVFYEIEFPIPGDGDSIRRRFFLRGVPMYYADQLEWSISLERSHNDRNRAGDLG